jgi:Xaa-Pro aminopeptidase
VRRDLLPIDASGRVDLLRHQLDDLGHQVMLVREHSNVWWLTGFTGSNGWVVVTPDRLVLVTDGRYLDRARDEVHRAGVDAQILVGKNPGLIRQHLVDVTAGYPAVAAEANHLTYAQWTELSAEIALAPDGALIEDLRRRKDDAELARIECAAAIATEALADVVAMLADEPTEADVRDELDHRMRRLGADGPSYDTIVASGPDHAARPHHLPSPRTIVEGDAVIIDVGALVEGYHSDMTRTFVVGEPTDEQLDKYRAVLAAQQAGLDAVSAHGKASAVDEACRSALADEGLGEWFVHGTGHGVGLDIHEEPFLNATSTAELAEGDVVTVEPGVYRSGFGGIRIEDLVVITGNGFRNLTTFPKDDPCLPSRPTT